MSKEPVEVFLNCSYVVPLEEEAQQKAHILAVQRELEEADEPNLLEEEGNDQVAISLLYQVPI